MSSKESFRGEEEWREKALRRCLEAWQVSVAFESANSARLARFRFYPTRNRLALADPNFLHIELTLNDNILCLRFRPPPTPL